MAPLFSQCMVKFRKFMHRQAVSYSVYGRVSLILREKYIHMSPSVRNNSHQSHNVSSLQVSMTTLKKKSYFIWNQAEQVISAFFFFLRFSIAVQIQRMLFQIKPNIVREGVSALYGTRPGTSSPMSINSPSQMTCLTLILGSGVFLDPGEK